ncbi:MAG: cellulase family glycosylhydrolase [Polyangiales bacterium]
MRRRTERALAAALALAAGPASAQRFVSVRDGHFALEGQRFRFVGANASVMHGGAHREALDEIFDAMVADGLRVARVWALGERPADAPAWTRDFAWRLGRDAWITESFDHLDRVIEAAGRRGLKLIVVLANRWGDYGGVPQYLSWAGWDAATQRSMGELGALAAFFDDGDARALYLAHVARVVTRVNARTGVAYRDDPTVMAWELINEADSAPRDRALLVRWTQETARAVHAMDPAHLVGAGHIGYTRQAQRDTWRAVQALPEVDYADAHAYPTTVRAGRTLAALDDFVDDHAELARAELRKPLVWGEFGFTATTPTHLGAPRAQWYQRFLDRADLDDADGALVWLYTTSRDPPREHGIFGDPAGAPRTEDLRAVLRAHATRWRAGGSMRNARLLMPSPEPRWRTDHETSGPGVRGVIGRRTGAGWQWSLAPEAYATLRAEASGRWDGFSVMHIWASGLASVRYRVRTPPGLVRGARVTLRVRVSSELPGRGEGATMADRSEVQVTLDDVPLGTFMTPLDDGAGRWVEVSTDDAAAVTALRRAGAHTLRFDVVRGPYANGLCLYGTPTGREPPPPDGGPLPGRVLLSLVQ